MILVSVGTQLPFDRLVRAVDQWATRTGERNIVAQIGPALYQPTALQSFEFLEPDQFGELQQQCDVMVSHAGMGSIITAMEMGKPIIIMARDDRRNEHRNGHQIATAKKFMDWPGVYVAENEIMLAGLLDRIAELKPGACPDIEASKAFVGQLRSHLDRVGEPSLLRRLRRRAH
ncbi:glycosyltransferase [Sphingomonas sp. Y38-1Y]|uniref:glycosyltransferase n=1 Tax=Sphingomonas sp. Y38-1Y TaxID=3078265 RepID=UPI0028E82FEF|nr:glycosyltransferase [Sphingomonas sp. Y38-1Y]